MSEYNDSDSDGNTLLLRAAQLLNKTGDDIEAAETELERELEVCDDLRAAVAKDAVQTATKFRRIAVERGWRSVTLKTSG